MPTGRRRRRHEAPVNGGATRSYIRAVGEVRKGKGQETKHVMFSVIFIMLSRSCDRTESDMAYEQRRCWSVLRSAFASAPPNNEHKHDLDGILSSSEPVIDLDVPGYEISVTKFHGKTPVSPLARLPNSLNARMH